MAMFLGLDIGSVNVKAVLLDESMDVTHKVSIQSRGNPGEAIQVLIKKILGNRKDFPLTIGVTGFGREMFNLPEEISVFNEIIALALGASFELPDARSVIEIGGHSSRWIQLDHVMSSDHDAEIIDFAINERCAAGSGAFLEQQAARLNLTIEEFSDLAVQASQGATIAGRCSVFAKTDMIHLQQKGTLIEEIAYGVCLALARNYVATILKGRNCVPPVLLTGGTAQNQGLVRALREVLKVNESELIVSTESFYTSAKGAGLGAQKSGRACRYSDTEELLNILEPKEVCSKRMLKPLTFQEIGCREEPSQPQDRMIEGYLGVDVGSVSTNLALVDTKGDVIAGVYLPTRGQPLEAVKEAYVQLTKKCKSLTNILGVGTTGSGRYLAGNFLEADVIHNEITCQLVGAKHYFSDVDTVFEIGGQDSKYIGVRDGRIFDFTMNKICAAGTGSFLEEQAAQLGISIESEFLNLAKQSENPCDLGSQCTVFMDTELVNALNQGVSVSDITAGLAYSVARNYLEKVVADRSIGERIVFQGGVASNAAVVRAFSMLLNKTVRVHPYNRISGAIGAALMAKDTMEMRGSIIPRTNQIEERIHQPYTITSFQCHQCTNRCQVNRIRLNGKDIYFGDTCERYTSQQQLSQHRTNESPLCEKEETLPNLFKERDDLLRLYVKNPPRPSHRIALPKTSFLYEYMPFWTTFFNHLECQVCLSPDTNMEILEMGLKKLPAETCLPIKIVFGHLEWSAKEDLDYIFIPSVIDLHQNPEECHYLCPYCEHIPYMLRSAFDAKLLFSCVNFNSGVDGFLESMEIVRKTLGKKKGDFREAFFQALSAQKEFSEKLKTRGKEILERFGEDGRNLWAVLGKPYNVHDAFLNLHLSKHLQKLKVISLPIDFIPLADESSMEWPGMPPWRYNQQIVKASLWCQKKKNIYPIIVSNFGCGPDAFTMKHLSKILEDKLHLFLEVDEHRGEVGLITRLEAFWDETKEIQTQVHKKGVSEKSRKSRDEMELAVENFRKRKFILPYFADHARSFAGAMRGIGIDAEVLPQPDARSLTLGEQYSSGKECHAYAILAGDLIKFAQSEREGNEVYYFPGTKNICLLAQYAKGMNYLLEDLGIEALEVLSPSSSFLFKILGPAGLKLLWQGLVAVDLLVKAACERRPYEVKKGLTDGIHSTNLQDIERGLASGSFVAAWKRCVERLNSIEIQKHARPIIGIAGDVYTRQHPVANHDLFRRLENLGCEVWPGPFLVDDVDFAMRKSISRKFKEKRYREFMAMGLLNMRKDFETLRIQKRAKGMMDRLSEPSYKNILRFIRPYISPENNRVLLLNIAKMVDYAERGADGIVNVICLNCMLGTVSEAISAQIKKDFDRIPIPTLVFSGSDVSSESTKLEAFVYQARKFAERRNQERFFVL